MIHFRSVSPREGRSLKQRMVLRLLPFFCPQQSPAACYTCPPPRFVVSRCWVKERASANMDNCIVKGLFICSSKTLRNLITCILYTGCLYNYHNLFIRFYNLTKKKQFDCHCPVTVFCWCQIEPVSWLCKINLHDFWNYNFVTCSVAHWWIIQTSWTSIFVTTAKQATA